MARVPHILKANQANQRPTRHAFVDIETTVTAISDRESEQKLRLGWVCYWRRETPPRKDTIQYHFFRHATEFWTLIDKWTKPKEPLYLVAHNISFDLGILGIFHELESLGYEMKSIYLANMTGILTFTKDKRKIIVLDNGNYFPGKLSKLGEAIGFPKEDVNPLSATDEEIIPYCKRDVEIMQQAWSYLYSFLDEHDLGNWGKTLPSQAFNAYRHRFMQEQIFIHTRPEAMILEREAYHGGRTSVFFKGHLREGPYYKVDVNSMYPFVMSNQLYPVKLERHIPSLTSLELKRRIKISGCIAKVQVRTTEPVYPVLHKKHLVYPIGKFDCVLTTPELERAFSRKEITRCYEASFYQMGNIFSSYVSFFYKLKLQYTQEQNSTFRTFTKLYLNSLYGKFGQKHHQWEKLTDEFLLDQHLDYISDLETGKSFKVYYFGDSAWTSSESGEAFNSFPAIAGHVTAYARLYLWELAQKAGAKNYFYTDTDSLVVNQQGHENLRSYLDDDLLGALKTEEKSETVTIKAPKCYALGEAWKRKGVRKSSPYLGNDTWQVEQFPSFKSQSGWKPTTVYKTLKVDKHLTYRLYDTANDTTGWIEPFDSADLDPEIIVKPEVAQEIEEIQAQIEALQTVPKVPQQLIFKVWDYTKGKWKRARDKFGMLVPIEYSSIGNEVEELGFDDLDSLQEGILNTIKVYDDIRVLTEKLKRIKYGTTESNPASELPF